MSDPTPSPETRHLDLPLVEQPRVLEFPLVSLTPSQFAGLHEDAEAAVARPENSDDLTRIGNARQLMNQLGVLTNRYPGQFGLVMVDLDGLKQINDNQGHAAGDERIRQAANVLLGNTRHSNDPVEHDRRHETDDLSKYGVFACRRGGDEFVLPLPGVVNDEQMEGVIERLQARFAAAGVPASIGGRVHRQDETSAELLEAADGLMYEAKRANQRRRYEDSPLRKRAASRIARVLFRYADLPLPR